MIKISELRVGNLVYAGNKQHEGEIVEITSIHGKAFVFESKDAHGEPYSAISHPDDTLGIPLTEEWLVKFGAEKTGGDYSNTYSLDDGDVFIRLDEDGVWFEGNDLGTDNDVPIETVHHFQNFYFFKTLKELTIK